MAWLAAIYLIFLGGLTIYKGNMAAAFVFIPFIAFIVFLPTLVESLVERLFALIDQKLGFRK